MNTTVISGRLVRNPGYNEVENEKGLHKIAKFVLAVRRNYSDEVSFIPVKAFAKKAEFARDYLMQGTKVMVEGEIVTGNYEDKDTGKKIYTTEVYANRIEFAGAKMVDRPPFPEDAEGFLEIPEAWKKKCRLDRRIKDGFGRSGVYGRAYEKCRWKYQQQKCSAVSSM